MKKLLLFLSFSLVMTFVQGQDVSVTHLFGFCPSNTQNLTFSGTVNGKNSYSNAAYTLEWSGTQWEFIELAGPTVLGFSTYDSAPNPPDNNTANSAGQPYTSSAACLIPNTPNSFAVQGTGTQNGLNPPCVDMESPMITCPGDQTRVVDTNCQFEVEDFTSLATATDDCPDPTVTQLGFGDGGTPSGFTGAGTGSLPIVLEAEDGAGNTSQCSFTLFFVDTTPPEITCPGDANVSVDANECFYTAAGLEPVITDNCSSPLPSYTITGALETSGINNDINGLQFPIGASTVTYTTTDLSSNSTSCSFAVTVSDGQPPNITCQDISVSAAAGQCGQNVTFSNLAMASDDCGSASLSFSAMDGDFFSVGTNPVIATATDGSNSASCTINITVTDDEDPTITCPGDISTSTDPAMCGAVVNYTVTGADNCPDESTVSTPMSGSVFSVGTTPVSATVTDASGNSASCSFNVTVNDNDPPSITCPGNVNMASAPGACSPVINGLAPSASDNCAMPPAITYVLMGATTGSGTLDASGTPFNIGLTTLTYTADDDNGNMPTCTTTITITDPTICGCDQPQPGDACDDNDPLTINDQIRNDCSCLGDIDTDGDGLFDFDDNCPNVPNVDYVDITIDGNIADFPGAVGTGNAGLSYYFSSDASFFYIGITGATIQNGGDNYHVAFRKASDGSTNTPQSGMTFPAGLEWTYLVSVFGPDDICYFPFNDPTNCQQVGTSWDDFAGFGGNPTSELAIPRSFLGSLASGAGGVELAIWTSNNAQDFVWSTFPNTTPTGPAPQTLDAYAILSYPTPSGAPQADADMDGTGDACDDCPNDPNKIEPGICGCGVSDNPAAPSITCPGNVTVSNDAGQCEAVVTYAAATATDNCLNDPAITYSQASGTVFSVGTTTVTATATDATGGSSSCTFSVTVNDTESPTITCPAAINVNNDSDECGAVVSFNTPAGADNCPGQSVNCSSDSGDFFNIGTTPVTCTVTDGAGNQVQCTFNVTVSDAQNPSITCPMPQTRLLDTNCNYEVEDFTGAATAMDNCPGVSISQSPAQGQTFNGPGPTVIVLTATDAVGNTASCNMNLTLEDNIPPSITCPPTANRNVNANCIYSLEDFTGSATVNDNCDASPSVSQSPTAGTNLGVGNQVVTLEAMDASGNTSTCSFSVSVSDNIPPNAVCQNGTVQLDGSGNGSINGSALDGGSTDNCPGAISYVPTSFSFSCSDVGPNTVTVSVVDASFNSTFCTAIVTVQDNIAPTAVCQDATVVLSGTSGTLTASQVDGGSTDNCPPPVVSVLPTMFTCNDVGTNPVTLLVQDGSLNFSTCTATVTVQDNTPPTAVCQTATVQVGEMLMPSQVDNGSSDNCTNPPDLSVVPNTFGCGNVGSNIVTLTVDDTNGNSTFCTTTVTVEANTPPTAVCANFTLELDGTGSGMLSANDVDGGSSSVCSTVSLSVMPTNFTCSDVGPNTVTLTATDDSNGLSATCTAVVTVEDPLSACCAPASAVCNNFNVALGSNGMVTIQPADVGGGSTAECGLEEESVMPNMFDCDDSGTTTTVTYSITDINGAMSSCTAEVTITSVAPTVPTVDRLTRSACVGGSATVRTDAAGTGLVINWEVVSAPMGASFTAGDVLGVGENGPDYRTDLDADGRRLRIKGNQNVVAGTYQFQAFTRNEASGCISDLTTAIFEITIYEKPTVDITADPDGDLCLGTMGVQYDATITSTDGGTYSYAWCAYNSDDGSGMCFDGFSNNTAQMPTRNWTSSAGAKSVGVTVESDVNGCMATDLYSFDVVAPTMVACPGDQMGTLITNPGSFDCAAVVTWDNPSVDPGPCDPVTLTIVVDGGAPETVTPGTPYTATFDGLGAYSVTYTLVDAVGNTSTCSFNVFIDGLPCGWVDNGGINCGGSSSGFNNSNFFLLAGPCVPDFPFTVDQTSFVFTELCGDGEIIARVESISGGQGFAGVMMRDSEYPGSPKMAIGTNTLNRVRKEVRVLPDYPAFPQSVVAYDQFWVRLTRNGPSFRGFASPDGVQWFPYLFQNIQMGACIKVGLYAYSEKATSPITANFSNVSVNGVPVGALDGGWVPSLNLGDLGQGTAAQNLQDLSPAPITIVVFPNPTSGELNLDLGSFVGERADIRVFNSVGQQVLTHRVDEIQIPIERLDMRQLQAGMYHIAVKLGDTMITKRVVIAR